MPDQSIVTERVQDIVSDPQNGPEIVRPHKTIHAMKVLDRGQGLKLGDCILRTCTTCDCFRGDADGDGYCHHVRHFEQHGCEQYIGSFHGFKNGLQPQGCPIAKTDEGLWHYGIWWDYEANDYAEDDTIASR